MLWLQCVTIGKLENCSSATKHLWLLSPVGRWSLGESWWHKGVRQDSERLGGEKLRKPMGFVHGFYKFLPSNLGGFLFGFWNCCSCSINSMINALLSLLSLRLSPRSLFFVAHILRAAGLRITYRYNCDSAMCNCEKTCWPAALDYLARLHLRWRYARSHPWWSKAKVTGCPPHRQSFRLLCCSTTSGKPDGGTQSIAWDLYRMDLLLISFDNVYFL